ncbi:hypothetical protein ACNAW0_07400 [Micromonospora sp. SL1-18]|uniref:hypothetical protein n=1 Tax=Micromonospora sp. SL1-18 TaxID=3399128 RepID=UPI003A4E1522
MVRRPEPGDLLRIDGYASVQFAGDRALTFRVVSVCDRPTYTGWIWLTGYVINPRGNATAKREIYIQLAGLRRAARVPASSRSRATRPVLPVMSRVTAERPATARGCVLRPMLGDAIGATGICPAAGQPDTPRTQ